MLLLCPAGTLFFDGGLLSICGQMVHRPSIEIQCLSLCVIEREILYPTAKRSRNACTLDMLQIMFLKAKAMMPRSYNLIESQACACRRSQNPSCHRSAEGENSKRLLSILHQTQSLLVFLCQTWFVAMNCTLQLTFLGW